jgi:hypothetical protein
MAASTSLIKTWFKPSAKTVEAIDTHLHVGELHMAHVEFNAKMRDLETRFEEEASRLRSQYMDRVQQMHAAE